MQGESFPSWLCARQVKRGVARYCRQILSPTALTAKDERRLKLFEKFLEGRRSDLSKIACRTRGEYTIDDLASESWLLVIEIGRRRGWVFNFSGQDD